MVSAEVDTIDDEGRGWFFAGELHGEGMADLIGAEVAVVLGLGAEPFSEFGFDYFREVLFLVEAEDGNGEEGLPCGCVVGGEV